MAAAASSKRAASLDIPPAAGEVCLHVLVVGFDHEIGNVLEYAFPPLQQAEHAGVYGARPAAAAAAAARGGTSAPETGAEAETEPLLPPAWANLTFQAMPDGVHNTSEEDAPPAPFFFTVPAIDAAPGTDPGPPLHAVACYRQLDATAVRQRQAATSPESSPRAGGGGGAGAG
eukprot:SAG22_NODE_878_length_6715_cov_9.368652_1_plen_172_part_10